MTTYYVLPYALMNSTCALSATFPWFMLLIESLGPWFKKIWLKKQEKNNLHTFMGFSGGADSRVCLQCRRPRFNSWIRKIPWRRKWLPTSVFLPEEFHGQKNMVGHSPWGCRDEQDWATDTFTFHFIWVSTFIHLFLFLFH